MSSALAGNGVSRCFVSLCEESEEDWFVAQKHPKTELGSGSTHGLPLLWLGLEVELGSSITEERQECRNVCWIINC